jgi:hypothetical protein
MWGLSTRVRVQAHVHELCKGAGGELLTGVVHPREADERS